MIRILFITLLLFFYQSAFSQELDFCEKVRQLHDFSQGETLNVIDEREKRSEDENERKKLLQLKKKFTKNKLEIYHSAYTLFEEANIACSDVRSLVLIETFLNHNNYHDLYLIVHTVDFRYHVVGYNVGKMQGRYLGIMEEDFFSQAISFMSPSLKSIVSKNYISYAKFSSYDTKEVELLTNVNLWTINQIALIEKIIFRRLH